MMKFYSNSLSWAGGTDHADDDCEMSKKSDLKTKTNDEFMLLRYYVASPTVYSHLHHPVAVNPKPNVY